MDTSFALLYPKSRRLRILRAKVRGFYELDADANEVSGVYQIHMKGTLAEESSRITVRGV